MPLLKKLHNYCLIEIKLRFRIVDRMNITKFLNCLRQNEYDDNICVNNTRIYVYILVYIYRVYKKKVDNFETALKLAKRLEV